MKNLEIKKQLAQQAIMTDKPAETLEMLYFQNRFAPQNHKNPLTNKEFHGKNIWVLELTLLLNGYTSCEWSTFAQYRNDNNGVKKGEKGTYLTLAVYNKEKDENGEKKEKLQFFKGYTVFNKEQTRANEEPKEEQKTDNQKVLNLWEQKYEVVA